MTNKNFKLKFERANFEKTIQYIVTHHINAIDEKHRDDIEGYLLSQVSHLMDESLSLARTADFTFFQSLCHHPIEGVACLYVLGDTPKEPVYEFQVPVKNSFSQDENVMVCLYTYLI